jgi:DNA polymerase-3 subunit delta'
MLWNDIVGHRETVSVLRRLVAADRVPHAILLVGAKGIGKGLVAHTLAAAMLCQANADKPCGVCAACRRIASNAHPDLIHFEANGDSLKIEQMRDLQSAAALSPVMGGRRAVIIEDAERLTLPAANSLLKILEEPSQSLLFILTAGSVHSLLNTIVSRCRILHLVPVAADSLAAVLVKAGYSTDVADVAARLSGGRLGRAMALLEPDGLVAREKALTILRRLPEIDTLNGWNTVIRLEGSEADSMPEVVEQLAFLLRDMLLARCGCDQLIFNTDLSNELNEIARGWSEAGLGRALKELMEVSRALSGNANSRLLCEALLLRLKEYHAVS